METKFMQHYSEDWGTCVFCSFIDCECNDTLVYETKEEWRNEIRELDNKIKELQEAIKTTMAPPVPKFWAWKISSETKCPDCGSTFSTYDGCCEAGESYLKYQYTKRFYPNAIPILMEEVNGKNIEEEEGPPETETTLPELLGPPERGKKFKGYTTHP